MGINQLKNRDINQLKKLRKELSDSLRRQVEEDLKKDPKDESAKMWLKMLDDKDKFYKIWQDTINGLNEGKRR